MQLQTGPIYGPVQSRRLGRSLGVNLAPAGVKACNMNCVYCQYGWTKAGGRIDWPQPQTIVDALDAALAADNLLDHITVAGNGEPTLHPAFARIVDGLVRVRDARAPRVKLAILSNGSTLNRLDVRYALPRFDERHLKLDAGDATTLRRVNACPVSLGRLIADLRGVGHITLQAMFVRDAAGIVDNTTPEAVSAWVEAVRRVRPESVHLYSLDRSAPNKTLVKIDYATLQDIAQRVEALGIKAEVFH